jgi:hypothetical protein
MEKWEYITAILHAENDKQGVHRRIAELWPGWKPPKYAPECLIPKLNEYGREGWELISIENVSLGSNWDIAHPHGGPGNWAWSNAYLVALKRRIAD